MVREVRNTLGSTNLAAPISKPQSLRVEARPVDTSTTFFGDRSIDSLVAGLSQFNPALNNFLQQKQFQKDVAEVQQGKQDASLGKEQLSDTELYAHGFLKTKGSNAAAEDMAELQGYMEQNYNPDTDDFKGTVQGWLKTKTNGVTDKSFLEGYAPGMDRGINQLSNHYTTVRQDKLKADLDSSVMQNLSLGMKAYVDQGLPVPDEFITAKKQEFATNFKMSEAKFEELQFLAAKEFGNKGNFSIFEQFKKNKSDGTPGMYFNSAWKEKIDAAEVHAKTQYLQMSTAAEKQLKADREGRQEQALQSVFTGALTGEYGDAVAQFKKLVTEQPNLFLPSEISEWTNKLASLKQTSALEETEEQELNALKMLDRVERGAADTKHVMEAAMSGEITRKQASQLIQQVSSYRTQQRQLILQEQALEKSIYDSKQYRSAESWINRTLTTETLNPDIAPGDKQLAAQIKANALLELAERSKGMKPYEVQGLANELAERYSKMLPKSFLSTGTGTNNPLKGSLRFQTPNELIQAHQQGKISDTDFDYQLNIFKSLDPRRNTK